MARTKISEFSATPASNTDIDSINLAEGCAPSGINDAIRELMAQLKDFQTGAVGDSFNGPVGTTTAAAGAFTTLAASGAVTLSGGTANGVAYLNGSKVVTSGSALTFDGTNFGVGTSNFDMYDTNAGSNVSTYYRLKYTGGNGSTNVGTVFSNDSSGSALGFWRNNSSSKPVRGAAISADWSSITAGSEAASLIFSTQTGGASASEQMRLTSTGLGIGTSSPSQKLTVAGTQRIQKEGAGYEAAMLSFSTLSETGAIYRFGMASGGSFAIGRSDTSVTNLTLDTSGNLGLGVTPSAWDGSFKALQVSNTSLFSQDSTGAGWWSKNARNVGGTWYYIGTGNASYIEQGAGAFKWNTSASGTAGNAITFTQAMSLTADGNLLVGTTSLIVDANCFNYSPGNTWGIFGHASGVGSGTDFVKFYYGGGQIGSISQNGTTAVAYNTSSDYRLKNITGPVTTSGAYIDNLNPVEGTWKADGSTFVGLIAHEVQEASRTQVATGTKDGEKMQAMDYSSAELIANLIAEVKSLRQRVATLESK